MKKTSLLLVAAVTGMIMLGSCGGNSQQQQVAEAEDSVSLEDIIPTDRTIYGLCGDGSAMNTLELITDNGDTLTLSLTAATEAGKVLGAFQVGDRMAVLANKEKTDAQIVINMNTLLGDWVMPNPIDGSSEVGIRIKEGGIAESIDQSSIVYRTWKIFNGNLEIYSIREGGGDEEELNLYEITLLGADSLVYRSIGKSREETEVFEYSRWKEKPQIDLRGLQLEQTYEEYKNL